MTSEQRHKEWLELKDKSDKLMVDANNFRTKCYEELYNFQKDCTHTYDNGETAIVDIYGRQKCQLCFAEGNLHLPKIKRVKILNFNSHLQYGEIHEEYLCLIGQEFEITLNDQNFGTIWVQTSDNSRIIVREGEYEILETY